MAAKKTAKSSKKSSRMSAKSTSKKITLSIKKPLSKSQMVSHIAETVGVKRGEVSAMFDVLGGLIKASLDKKGPGEFNLPGLLKCRVIRKPATKARKGINPFTGEPTVFKAKPARNVVKIRPLKKLKEAVQ